MTCFCKWTERCLYALAAGAAFSLVVYEILAWLSYLQAWASDLQICNGPPGPVSIPLPRFTVCSRASVDVRRQTGAEFFLNYLLSLALPSKSVDVLRAANDTMSLPAAKFLTAKTSFEKYLNSSGVSALTSLLALGYHCSSSMVSCRLGNESIACCQSTLQLVTLYGPCFAMDFPLLQTVPGFRGGLTLTLQVDDANFQKFNAAKLQHPGFIVFVDSFDYHLQEPTLVSAGREHFLQLRSDHISNVDAPYSSQSCRRAAPGDYRLFSSAATSFAGDEFDPVVANAETLNRYRADRVSVEDCKRSCFGQLIFDACGCYSLPFTDEDFTLPYSTNYCYTNESQTCVRNILEGTSLVTNTTRPFFSPSSSSHSARSFTKPPLYSNNMTGGGGSNFSSSPTSGGNQSSSLFSSLSSSSSNSTLKGGSGKRKRMRSSNQTQLIENTGEACAKQCPSFCFERRSSLQLAQTTELNAYVYPNIPGDRIYRTAVIHAYYPVSSFSVSKELTPIMTAFPFFREIGLSVCIWSVLLAILVCTVCGLKSFSVYVLELVYGPQKRRIDPYPMVNGGDHIQGNFEGDADGK